MNWDQLPPFLIAIAAIFSALAWPISLVIIVLFFRREIKLLSSRFPKFIDRIQSVKIGSLEAELEKLGEKEADTPGGAVTASQVKAANDFELVSDSIGFNVLTKEMDRLAFDYDTIRRSKPSGHSRTREMTKILIQMRGLAKAVSGYLPAYMSSGAPGSRLAAIAIMQMEPGKANLEWLSQRFENEAPFLFYHAALALRNLANDASPTVLEMVKVTAAEALKTVQEFDGEPDVETIAVLKTLI